MPPRNISYSQVSCYAKCPYQFYLKYVLGEKEPIKSPALELGSKVHDMIAKGMFVSSDPTEQTMLTNAKKFLDSMPSGGISETSFNDPHNPGRFYGSVCGQSAVAVFDVYWEPEVSTGCDFKSGKFYSSYTDQFEMQCYFLNETFKQKYDQNLKKFHFLFLRDGSVYSPKLLTEDKIKNKTEKAIKKVLFGISEGNYEKKCSSFCNYCGMNTICALGL